MVAMVLIVGFIALDVYKANANIIKTDVNLRAALPVILKNWNGQGNQRTPNPSASPTISPSATLLPTVSPSASPPPDDFPLTGILDDFNRTNQGPPPSSNWDIVQVGHSVYNNEAIGTEATDILSAWKVAAWKNLEGYMTIKSDPDLGVFSIYILQDYKTVELADGYEVWFDTRTGYDVLHMCRVDKLKETQLGELIDISDIQTGDSIGFRLRDGKLMAYWKQSGSSWTLLGTRYDATYSGPFYLVPETWSATSTFDDFGGGDI
jgi:hypothetical protein